MTYSAADGPNGWAWLAMTVSVLLLVGVSVGAYLQLFRGDGRRARRASSERRLSDQFARGLITEKEYLHLTAALDSARTGRRTGSHPRPGSRRHEP